MNQITEIFRYSEKTARVSIENQNVATKAEPGQFVIVKFGSLGVNRNFFCK